MPATGRSTFASAVRVIHRIHGDTAYGRAYATPTFCPGFSEFSQRVLRVPDFSDCRPALNEHPSGLTRPKAHQGIRALATEILDGGSGRPGELGTFAGFQFDTVHNGANRNIFERKSIPSPDRNILSRGNRVTHSQTLGRDDVTPFTISIEQQRDVGASVGIVFQTLYLRRDAVLFAREINYAIVAFVATAAMADGDPAGIVPAIGRTLGFCK